MRRYSNTKTRFDKSGLRVYGTTYYPEILLDNTDSLLRTTIGDRLDNLAFSFYEDSSLWWVIAKANGIRGKMVLEPGTLIRIPGNVSTIIGKFKELNRSS